MLSFSKIKKVPDVYLAEYIGESVKFIKKRVGLFCSLTFSLYFIAIFLWFLFYPKEFTSLEIIVGGFLLFGGVLVLALNARARSLFAVKLNAYLFTALLLILLVKLGVVYEDSAEISSSTFVFTLFLVSVTIPWKSGEVIFLAVMNMAAYTVNFLYLKQVQVSAQSAFTGRDYIEGVIYILMAVLLCWVIRWHETERDIENFVLFKKVEENNDQMKNELEWAKRVHKTLIPKSVSNQKIDIAVTYLPVYYIGGDYARYDFLEHDRMVFLISDVTGHGVPAALLVNRIHAEFQRFAKEGKMPGELMHELNDFIKEDFEGADMYLTAFCGMVDFRKMTLNYSNWGHPPQYIYRDKTGKIDSMDPQTCMLGVPLEDQNIYEEKIKLETGDKILLYTDGIIETMNEEKDEFGYDRLKEFIIKNHKLSTGAINDLLISNLNSFKYNGFKDDICLMTMEIKSHHGLFF